MSRYKLISHLKTRVGRRKLSTFWNSLLDDLNELNPNNRPHGYVELNEECEGVLEYRRILQNCVRSHRKLCNILMPGNIMITARQGVDEI